MAGSPYNVTLLSGGTAPYSLFTQSVLPPGLDFVGGALTGTPAPSTPPDQPQTYAITVLWGDSISSSAEMPYGNSTDYTLTIDPALAITTTTLATGAQNMSYSQPVTVTGGVGPYVITATGLPAGLVPANGAIGGVPAVGGNFQVNVTATDSLGRQVTRQYVLAVIPQLQIVTVLPPATPGVPYTHTLAATGAIYPPVWSLVPGGTLPIGFTLSSAGTLTGLPQQPGDYTFRVNASVYPVGSFAAGPIQTVTAQLTLVVRSLIEPLVITTGSLPDGTYRQPYAAAVLASGGEEPYTWSAGGPPPGLSVSSTGAVYGVPSDIGTFALPVTVTDAGGRSASKTFSLKIVAPPLTITTVSPLAGAKTGVPLSVAFSATGGVPPYTWLPSSGPPGTTFAGGSLTGIPAEAGQFTFAVQVRDSKGTVARKEFAVTVTALPLSVSAGALPAGQVGQAYSAAFSALGGSPPYRWSISGLPTGLAGDDAGNIRGNPTATGNSSVTATVTDSKGAQASATVDLTILPGPLSIETGSPLPNGTVGVAYSQSFAACGGTPPYRWSITAGYAGALDITGDGVLQGVPAEAGDFNFFVQLTDATGAASSKMFSVKIDLPVLTVTTGSLPNGTAGLAYAAGVSGSGAVGGMRWSASGLPAGLSMDAGGSIVGTPSAPGASSVSVTVTDGTDRTASKTLSLTVGLPAAPNPSFLGIPDTSPPASQLPLGLGLDGKYPVPIAGTITLTFAADPGGDDPAIQFSNGRRTVDFNIPAGSNLATFTIPALALQTGTVAGTITLTASLSAMGQPILPVPVRTIRINPMPPVISRVSIARTATGFDVTVTGFANTRDISQATFRFTPAAGVTLQTTEVTLPVDALFSRWYQDPASLIYGSQFLFTQPFTIGGDAGSIASVSVTLASSAGRSDPASANIP